MIRIMNRRQTIIWLTALTLIVTGGWPGLSIANDTDIYNVNTKQNCYILLDNSTSMGFGVYEQNIDYYNMFSYLFTLNESGSPYNTYIYDTVNGYKDGNGNWVGGTYFYTHHEERRKIFLWKGAIGVTISQVGGKDVSYTGDAADPDYLWYTSNLVDTHTLIDSSGNLTDDGSGKQRLTTDSDGYVLLDGNRLPLDRSIKLHKMITLYDGTQVDNGFGGLLNAPGYYFSGYKSVNDTPNDLTTASNGDTNIFFFVTGNWINMQAMYNLHYVTNNPDPSGAHQGDDAWRYEEFPLTVNDWSVLAEGVGYPQSGDYASNLAESTTEKTIVHPGAKQMQLHFSAFDVQGDGNTSDWQKDWVALYDVDGNLLAKYDNDNKPTGGDGWSLTINGDTVKVTLHSDSDGVAGTGYTIDKCRLTYGPYVMQTRLDVAKDALDYVLDKFIGKVNWGYATFQYTGGGSGDGASIETPLNPTVTDDTNRAAIKGHVDGTDVSTNGGSPLGEALQDVFEDGYYGHRNSLDNLPCRKNYVITVTDGFPSDDNEWDRISNVPTFTDIDGDGWTEDPYQYATPPGDYYDDVGHWMYTHSWQDKTEVTDPANSYTNVITHDIAFGMDNPLLKDAAEESGGLYIAAYNKPQLVAAFYSLALQMTEAISFTSPVVSVDAANKIQNGDDLYLGLFKPQDNQSWIGNLKKFKLGDGSAARPDIWMLYDGANQPAIDATGKFKDNTAAFWADDLDPNDHDNYGAMDVTEDGVGEVMIEGLQAQFQAGNDWTRPIYTYDSATASLVKIKWDTISAAQLDVPDDSTRDKVINYLYGYTYDADAITHAPIATRDWAMGAVVHSRPVVIDYYDSSSALTKRYIAVGADDGMLHVFDDADGKEVFAFVPEDLLPKLKLVSQSPQVDMVDGPIVLYRKNNAPKYLIFGERRGGGAYWCIDVSDPDPSNWHVAWSFSNSEMAQSWSTPIVATLPVGINSTTGKRTFQDVLVFTGGYDPYEDNFPEPFDDPDHTGTVFQANGNVDTSRWDKNDSSQDVYDDDLYNLYNPDKDQHGRGVYVVDIDDPTTDVFDSNGTKVLPFKVTYGASDITTGTVQTLTAMKYCFPASPVAIRASYSYTYDDSGTQKEERLTNVLKCIYVTDIYANIYKINLNFDVTSTVPGTPPFSLSTGWKVTHIFSGNPGSSSTSGHFGQGANTDDQGRKTFYPPAVSWGGACNYFDAANYMFPNVDFSGLDGLAVLYFGTGDREHPNYTMIKNRFYAVYDDSSVTAKDSKTHADIPVSSVPYTENNLMNLTCDELDDDTTVSGVTKTDIKTALTDDVTYDNGVGSALEYGATHEDDAKGWYIVLADQGDATACSNCSYANADTTDHQGEKVLSVAELYAGVIYFTSYQPSISDPCHPQGNGFFYSLNYCDATPAYGAGGGGSTYHGPRFVKSTGILGPPSEPAILTREGQAAAMAMMGGSIKGKDGGKDFEIKSPGYGLELYYWRNSDSQRKKVSPVVSP